MGEQKKTEALLPCPFCGASASGYAIEPHSHALSVGDWMMPDHKGSYVIEGDCACGSGLIGETRAEVTARWNTRAAAPKVEPAEQATKEVRCEKCEMMVLRNCDPDGKFSGCPVPTAALAAQQAPVQPAGATWRDLLRQSEENFNRQFGISVSAAWVYRDLEDLFGAAHDKRCPTALNLSDPCNCGANV